MKILTLPALGVLSFALAGCIARDDHYDHDHSVHHPSSSAENSSAANSESSAAESSSSVVQTSSSQMVVSSSSVMSSSSSVVVAPSSSSVMSSSAPAVSSSSVASSSSAPMVNIEDLSFSETLNEDQSIQTDSIANLGSALLDLIDKDAFDEFYLGLIAQGLDQAAIAKAASVMAPIGTAIGADFVERLAGPAVAGLLPKQEGIQLEVLELAIGRRGVEYIYTVNQNINDVAVALEVVLRFEESAPGARALSEGRNGYEVTLDGMELIVNELTLTTSDVTIALNNSGTPVLAAEYLIADVELLADGSNLKAVDLNGELVSLNLEGSAVNGIIGVTAKGAGTIDTVNAIVDMETGSSTLEILTPDVTVNMQGIDASN